MRYKVHCETENQWIEREWLIPYEQCPNNPQHFVTPGSLCVIEDNEHYVYDGTNLGYRKIRRQLIDYVTIHSGEMTTYELKIAAEHFCLPRDVQLQFLTEDELKQASIIFNRRAIDDRRARYLVLVPYLYNYLTYLQCVEIMNEIVDPDYLFRYIELGVEGTSEGDPAGLFDYVMGTEGTIFEGGGLINKPFTPRGNLTMTDIANNIMSVLKVSS